MFTQTHQFEPLLPADAADLGVEGGEVAMGGAPVIRQNVK